MFVAFVANVWCTFAKFRSQECFIEWVVIYDHMLVFLHEVCLYRFKYSGAKPPFE